SSRLLVANCRSFVQGRVSVAVESIHICTQLQQNFYLSLPVAGTMVQSCLVITVGCRKICTMIDQPSRNLIWKLVEGQSCCLENTTTSIDIACVEYCHDCIGITGSQ